MSDLSNKIFHDETAAREWLEARIWADGRTCPHCGVVDARPAHWVIDQQSQTAPQPSTWCLIPPHFKGDKFTGGDKPAYVLTSREVNRFGRAFWELARQANDFMHEIEVPSLASYGR